MFSMVSWTEFSEFIFLVLSLYYVSVAMIFYRNELSMLLVKFSAPANNNKISKIETNTDNVSSKIAAEEVMTVSNASDGKQNNGTSPDDISNIYVELETAIETSRNLDRETLLITLQSILKKYRKVSNKEFTETVNSQIQSQLAIHSITQLNDQEIELIWIS
jgi:hypothetical protein